MKNFSFVVRDVYYTIPYVHNKHAFYDSSYQFQSESLALLIKFMALKLLNLATQKIKKRKRETETKIYKDYVNKTFNEIK